MNLLYITRFLQEQCHLNPGDRIAVGVSGGVDSVCLLHILKSLGYHVIALHYDHQIRPASSEDARFVEGLCDTWGIQCEIASGNVPEYATANHLSLEEAARILRYRFLFGAARRWESPVMATAHHANDQAETVLMHFIRGAGVDGLRGMTGCTLLPEFDQSILLIRPFLTTWKQELVAYCDQLKLPYVQDKTNQDSTYFRNWLRLTLIPQIETFNPRFQEVLQRTSKSIQADAAILDEMVATAWENLGVKEGDGYLRIPVNSLMRLPPGILNRIIRKAVKKVNPELRDIEYSLVERFSGFLDQPPATNHMDLGGNLWLILEHETLTLIRDDVDFPVTGYPQISTPVMLAVPGIHLLGHSWKVETEEISAENLDFDVIKSAGRWEAWIDLGKVESPLELDVRQPGDRYSPFGTTHTIKVSDLMINQKVPVSARKRYPLLRDRSGIIWVPGIQIADRCKITTETDRILRIRILQQNQ